MEQTKESTFVSHVPCPECGSMDNAASYDDGHTYCFKCQIYTSAPQPDGEGTKAPQAHRSQKQKDLQEGTYQTLKARGLSEESCRKFGYQVGHDGHQPIQIANYRGHNGQVVAQKIRPPDKKFYILGDGKKMPFFGQHLWNTGKKLVICEGEIDTITVSQLQNHRWATVGLPNGSSSAVRSIKDNWDYLEGFEEIIIMFDMDEPGQTAAVKVAETLPAGKARIAHLPLKDANDCLLQGKAADVVNAIFQAREYRPDGIVAAIDLRDTVSEVDAASTITYPFDRLQEITKGLRKGELVTVTAGSGIGKSTFIRELTYHLHHDIGEPLGLMMLEESTKRSLLGLVGIHLSKNVTVNRSDVTDEVIKEGFDELFPPGRPLYLFDHFGSSDLDVICNRIQYMVRALGVRFCIIDHISILVSGLATNDERKLIDMAMTRLRTLVQELDIGLIIVSHLRRPEGDKGHEDGAKVRLGQLRGSHSIAQLSDICISLQIDPDNPNGDTRHLHVLKNRWTGETGFAGSVSFDRDSGRLRPSEALF